MVLLWSVLVPFVFFMGLFWIFCFSMPLGRVYDCCIKKIPLLLPHPHRSKLDWLKGPKKDNGFYHKLWCKRAMVTLGPFPSPWWEAIGHRCMPVIFPVQGRVYLWSHFYLSWTSEKNIITFVSAHSLQGSPGSNQILCFVWNMYVTMQHSTSHYLHIYCSYAHLPLPVPEGHEIWNEMICDLCQVTWEDKRCTIDIPLNSDVRC